MILLNTDAVFILMLIGHFITCRGEVLIICENDEDEITCPDGKVNVTRAVYGRTISGEPCHLYGFSNLSGNNSCAEPVDVEKLDCNFLQRCKFEPKNSQYPYPPDPCPGIKKYLNVTYTCINDDDTSTVTETTTEDGTSTLTETTTDGGTSTLTETMAGSSQSCHCPCSAVGSNPWQYLLYLGLTQPEIKEVMKPYLASLEKSVSIDRKHTNKLQRMMTSATDDRKSAKSIGYVGLAIIVTIALMLVAVDFLNIFKSCKRPRRS